MGRALQREGAWRWAQRYTEWYKGHIGTQVCSERYREAHGMRRTLIASYYTVSYVILMVSLHLLELIFVMG